VVLFDALIEATGQTALVFLEISPVGLAQADHHGCCQSADLRGRFM